MINKMTTSQYDKHIAELVKSIRTHATVFIDNSEVAKKMRTDKASKDLFYFAKTYFPHYIKADFARAHREMHKHTSVKGEITAVAGFRGLGKTTLLSIIKPVWLAVHKQIKFNCKVVLNNERAKKRTAAIRCEFLFNKRLINDFGEQVTGGEMHDFVTISGTRFLALGYMQGIRGELHGPFRPDYIDIDDLEDHKSFNERIARDKFQFVTEEAYGAFDRGRGVLIWLGNLTHQKSALNLFKKRCDEDKQAGKFLIYKLLLHKNGEAISAWPQNFSLADIDRARRKMGRTGFERHMQMNPIIDGLKFQAEWFRYYDKAPQCERIVTYCDPSFGSKTTSDYKAIITLGIVKNKYYVLDAWIRRASINDMIRKLYACDKEFSTRLFMESTLWQRVLWDYIPEVAAEVGYMLPVSGIDNKEKKELRIDRLEPLFEWGWLHFPANKTEDIRLLEDQLLGFPAYPNDDGPDALAGAVARLKQLAEPNTYRGGEKRMASRFSNMW